MTKTYPAADLRICDVGCHEYLGHLTWHLYCVDWESYHDLMCGAWAIQVWRPRLSYIYLLFRCPLSPWSHDYSVSWASVRKQVKLYESLSFTVVRKQRILGSETYIWPRLTASNAVNYHFYHVTKTCPAANLRIRVVSCHELIGQRSLIPEYCLSWVSSTSEGWILSTCHLKTPFATNMFALLLPASTWVVL